MGEERKRSGFTLIEIMTVVAVIGLVAALAIPNLLRSKISTNEAAAQAALKSISAAMASFRTVNSAYPSQLAELGSESVGGEVLAYLDDAIAQGSKAGYSFSITASDANTYTVEASPTTQGITGSRTFLLTHSGEITLASATSEASTSSDSDSDDTTLLARVLREIDGDIIVKEKESTTAPTDEEDLPDDDFLAAVGNE